MCKILSVVSSALLKLKSFFLIKIVFDDSAYIADNLILVCWTHWINIDLIHKVLRFLNLYCLNDLSLNLHILVRTDLGAQTLKSFSLTFMVSSNTKLSLYLDNIHLLCLLNHKFSFLGNKQLLSSSKVYFADHNLIEQKIICQQYLCSIGSNITRFQMHSPFHDFWKFPELSTNQKLLMQWVSPV